MNTHTADAPDRHPLIVQGGMGVGVSGWRLAGAVARTQNLGVVSGTALEVVYARTLQRGDPGGHVRRAFAHFPVPEVAEAVLERYFVAGVIAPGTPFRGVPMYTLRPRAELEALSVLTNFAEVWLAKSEGRGGLVGINYLYKIRMPLLASMYGALLAGVDYVIVGAGNPAEIPAALTHLARGEQAQLRSAVQYASSSDDVSIHFDPQSFMQDRLASRPRPKFLAIVSAADQAAALSEDPEAAADGFVVEAASAGGHNAPPRGPRQLTAQGDPRYGPLDDVDLGAMRRLERPFWLAGGYGRPDGLRRALDAGAAGIQVGTAFAFCRESGLQDDLRSATLQQARRGQTAVRTDARASPTGYPFKVVSASGTLADEAAYAARPRSCDLGFLRVPFMSAAGAIGYRCPAEPERAFAAKRGRAPQAEGRKCLCNALLANIGLGQVRRDGQVERPLLTAGDDVERLARFLPDGATSYGASDVIQELLRPALSSAPGSSREPDHSGAVLGAMRVF